MTVTINDPKFFPVRVNTYVPAMQYSSDVNYGGASRVSFGTPAAANATAIASAVTLGVAGSTDLTAVAQIVETYGRNLTVVASGASTSGVTVNGWDYLGQPVSETFTLNGTTPVVGNKAFKTMRSVTVNSTTGATTMNIGTGAKLGLPYKAVKAEFEITGGVAAAAGTLQNPNMTDPQTATTTDPRGMYTPTTTPNGTADISATFDFIADVNAAGNGGLHGLRHFAA